MRRTKRALAILALTLASCGPQLVPASTPTSGAVTLRIYAASAAFPLLNDLTHYYSRANPTVTFDIETGNYQMVLERVMKGDTPFLLTNHLGSESLWAAPLGQDGIAVIVHPANPVPGLTTEELRRIYQGHVGNWQDVGGLDMDIVVVSREDGSGTRAEFERLVMGARRTTRSAQIAPSSAAMVASVARQPGGIGYVSMSYVGELVRTIPVDGVQLTPDTVYGNIYPLRSTLYVVGLAEPHNDYLDFIAWIQSREGQMVVAQHYAPLLRP
ncbi:MAG: phosphate ABC transporter substrate-binding protein [Chloroflexi bacterium]|nr:phosphate ABC transporter substrate-binding protein [Chloroflexota bacterium]